MKRRKVEVGKGTREGISEDEKNIHIRTNIGNTRPRQGNASRSRCIRLCNGRSTVSKM